MKFIKILAVTFVFCVSIVSIAAIRVYLDAIGLIWGMGFITYPIVMFILNYKTTPNE